MYKAPVDEIACTLKHVAGMADALQSGALGDLGEDLVDAILAEAGRFATEEVAPLGDIGDRQGSRLVGGKVQTPEGWRDILERAEQRVKARHVADFLAGMTDNYALKEHRRLFDRTPDLG